MSRSSMRLSAIAAILGLVACETGPDPGDGPPEDLKVYLRKDFKKPWPFWCALPLTDAPVESLGFVPGYVEQMVKEDDRHLLALVHANWQFPLTGAALYRYDVLTGEWTLAYQFEEPWIWKFALTDTGLVYAMVRDGDPVLFIPGFPDGPHQMVVIDLAAKAKVRTYTLDHVSMEPVYFNGSIWYSGYSPTRLGNAIFNKTEPVVQAYALYEFPLGADGPREVFRPFVEATIAVGRAGFLFANQGLRSWDPQADSADLLPLGRDTGLLSHVGIGTGIYVLGNDILFEDVDSGDLLGEALAVRHADGTLENLKACPDHDEFPRPGPAWGPDGNVYWAEFSDPDYRNHMTLWRARLAR